MIDLDAINSIKSSDTRGVIAATDMLWQQVDQAWNETKTINLPVDYHEIDHVLVAGMGGSHLGAQLIKAVFETELKVPLIIQHEYTLPGFITDRSLVIVTSFSGTTEESLSLLEKVAVKNAKVICISSGGTLAEIALERHYPHYIFKSTYNPSQIPRYGSGYLFTAQLAFLAQLGVITCTDADILKITASIKTAHTRFCLEVPLASNPAKQLAQALSSKGVCLVASEHLIGSAYIFKNQLNESAKHFSTLFTIPELNHHLLEGLAHPPTNKVSLVFTLFESDLYYDRVKARYPITREIINKQSIQTCFYKPATATKLEQAFETLTFTSYVAVYLSLLNQVDPGPNPWVDYLKDSLRQIS